MGSVPGVRKIPCRRKWLPILVFLPGEFHGQRSLADYRLAIGSLSADYLVIKIQIFFPLLSASGISTSQSWNKSR